ncbi:MAG: hypothetical protein IIZ39_15085 [Blautia sp.]|nr:hypothetical protein [Blautia sp.]
MKAILCEPGYQARYVELDGSVRSIRDVVGGSFVREFLTDSVAVIRNRYTKNLKPNRRYMDEEAKLPAHFYKGNILFVGVNGELSFVDRLFVMNQFMFPDFPCPISLGLKEGEEVQVLTGIEFKERKPDRVVVRKEFEHFISVEFYFGSRSYRGSLNKASILCGDVVVTLEGEDLGQKMRNG